MQSLPIRIALWLGRKASFLFLGEELAKTLSSFRQNIGSVIEIDDILPKFLKVRPEDCPRFWVQTYWQKHQGYHEDHYFYLDAHYVFLLWMGGEDQTYPVACISFDPFGHSGVIIRQIQGRYGNNGYTKFIKWERLLIAAVQKWARLNGIRRIHIISAELSDYYNEDRHKSMYLRYDVTARRIGLKFNPWTRVYGSRISRLKLAA